MSARSSVEISRRQFLRISTTAFGGVLFTWCNDSKTVLAQSPSAVSTTSAHSQGGQFGFFIRIDPDNRVVIGCRSPEIGQGVRTALPMIIAEELDVSWADVNVEQMPLGVIIGPLGPAFKYGAQGAGGSENIPNAWADHRQFGAKARAMLVATAAARWGAEATLLSTNAGYVLHKDGRRLTYGELAADAAQLTPPKDDVPLKSPTAYRIIGKPTKVVDSRDIVTGRAKYGLDTYEMDAAVAVMARCPYFDGGIKSFDETASRKITGVIGVYVIPGPKIGDPLVQNLVTGIAVVATSTWAALKGREALKVEWTRGQFANESTEDFDAQCTRLLSSPGQIVSNIGDVEAVLSNTTAKQVEATYSVPFASHAPLEPQNCFVRITGDRVHIIAPLQHPAGATRVAALVTGFPRINITADMTRVGGGFGRRLTNDFIAEALHIAKLSGKPIKLMWTRDDDIRHDWYRPAGHHLLRAGIANDGVILAWQHRLASASRNYRRPNQKPDELWKSELFIDDFPANLVPNLRLEWCDVESGITRGSWRAPSHWANAFAVQSFLDEIAHATKQDALQLRLQLLGTPRTLNYREHGGPVFETARLAGVLKRVAKEIGWGRKLPKGRGIGLACHFTFGGYAAHAMEVSVSAVGALSIHRVVCAIDVGQPINPMGIEAQMQGATIDGLSAALLQEITVKDGRVVQSGFHDYPILPLSQTPPIAVHIIASTVAPRGCGEMGIPTVAPALANAIFNACGVRIRRLPVKEQLRDAFRQKTVTRRT